MANIRLGENRIEKIYYCPKVKKNSPNRMYLADQIIKGIVQRDLTGAETGLKRSVLLSFRVGKFFFLILKRHHHEKA
jgi:hypothetical protein